MKRQLVALVACALFVAALGVLAFAQAPPAPPKPGPEVKALGYFAGKWSSESELKPGPLGPGGKLTSNDTCEWFSGRFQLVCRGDGAGVMGPMKSMGIMSYSPTEKTYSYYGIDSMGQAELASGTKAGNTWTFSATSNINGQSFKSRYTVVESSPTAYTFKWESSADGTKWATLMEGKSTKAAPTKKGS